MSIGSQNDQQQETYYQAVQSARVQSQQLVESLILLDLGPLAANVLYVYQQLSDMEREALVTEVGKISTPLET